MFTWVLASPLPSCLSYPYFTMAKFPCLFLFYPTIFSFILSYHSCIFMCLHKSILEQGTVPIMSEYLLVLCCQHEPFTLGMKNDDKSSHLSSDTSLLYKTIYDLSHINEVYAARAQTAAQSSTAIRQQTPNIRNTATEKFTHCLLSSKA